MRHIRGELPLRLRLGRQRRRHVMHTAAQLGHLVTAVTRQRIRVGCLPRGDPPRRRRTHPQPPRQPLRHEPRHHRHQRDRAAPRDQQRPVQGQLRRIVVRVGRGHRQRPRRGALAGTPDPGRRPHPGVLTAADVRPRLVLEHRFPQRRRQGRIVHLRPQRPRAVPLVDLQRRTQPVVLIRPRRPLALDIRYVMHREPEHHHGQRRHT